MRRIFKYSLDNIGTPQFVQMPVGTEILSLQEQGMAPVFWAMVDDSLPTEKRAFFIIDTGHPMPDNPSKYIGTIQIAQYVWHVFELTRN